MAIWLSLTSRSPCGIPCSMKELTYLFLTKDCAIIGNNQYLCMKYQVKSVRMKHINRLKVVLVEKQKTGKWLAEQLGKDPATVSRWCSNSIQPSLK